MISNGKCSLCGGVFDKAAMTSHLKSCVRKQETTEASTAQKGAKRKPVFHLSVEGRYLPEYWMHLEVPVDATLDTLDRFLRDTWLECCGHMSAFEIQGARYSVEPMDFDDGDMNVKLKDVLAPGMKFYHAYDFGSTTHVTLKVVAERESEITSRHIKVLARNGPPVIPCSRCGAPAVKVCAECVYSGEGWLCEKCAGAHECGDEMLLPVVNSPRVGVCGYTG
jgi:predicted RNA-binding Zn-ribbon protein involved in translation (DUF1610 family)